MKLVLAYIQPYKVGEVRDGLRRVGVTGLTISQAEGFGRQSGQLETYRGTEYAMDFVPKTRVEVLTDDHLAPDVVATIEQIARTGHIGDGKIFVVDLKAVIRIRTGETGEAAIG
jgi:nitrogen regulatory protein P-II 2